MGAKPVSLFFLLMFAAIDQGEAMPPSENVEVVTAGRVGAEFDEGTMVVGPAECDDDVRTAAYRCELDVNR